MADEITVTMSLLVRNGSLQHISSPQVFQADQNVANGPTPGTISVPVLGVDVDLSELQSPGMCWMCNLDETNFVEYGIRDPQINRFYPFGKLLPGEIALFRFADSVGIEYFGTGTGTPTPSTNVVHIRAFIAACRVRIDVFDC